MEKIVNKEEYVLTKEEVKLIKTIIRNLDICAASLELSRTFDSCLQDEVVDLTVKSLTTDINALVEITKGS